MEDIPEVLSIALVGGGKIGTKLLKDLHKKSFINVVGVADINPDSPGMVFARENGIKTTDDGLELARMGEKIDILIEVTGVPEVKAKIKQIYIENNNRHTIILHKLIVRLLLTLIEGTDELIKGYYEHRGID